MEHAHAHARSDLHCPINTRGDDDRSLAVKQNNESKTEHDLFSNVTFLHKGRRRSKHTLE